MRWIFKEPLVKPAVLREEEFTKYLDRKNTIIVDTIERGVVLVDRINLINSLRRRS